MNELQRRAYIFLHAELMSYNYRQDQHWNCCEMLYRMTQILNGQKIEQIYYNADNESKFLQEVRKTLHLTGISIEDMIAVLEKLGELWEPRELMSEEQ